jgi:hypothetical protein
LRITNSNKILDKKELNTEMDFDFNLLFHLWFLIILTSISILCSFFVLYHFLFDRTLRQSLNNHVIIILILIGLFMQLTDIPLILHFYRFGTDGQISVSLSQCWLFIDYGCYSTQLNVFNVTWDLLGHQIIPTMIIVIASVSLFIRVLYKKSRLCQAIQWRKQRKMAIQILSITIIYQLLNFPWAFLLFCQMMNIPIDVEQKVFTVAYFFPYYLIPLFSFVCCGTLPELGKKFKKLLF